MHSLLQAYSYDMEYVQLEKNVAYGFSRLPLSHVETEKEDEYPYINYIENGNIRLNMETLSIETKKNEFLREFSNSALGDQWVQWTRRNRWAHDNCTTN